MSLEIRNVSNPTDRLCGQPHQIQRGSGLCVRGHSALGRPQPPPGLHQGMSPWLASPTWPLPLPDRRRLYLRQPWLNRPLHRPERDDPNAAMRSRYLCSNPRDPTASARALPRNRGSSSAEPPAPPHARAVAACEPRRALQLAALPRMGKTRVSFELASPLFVSVGCHCVLG